MNISSVPEAVLSDANSSVRIHYDFSRNIWKPNVTIRLEAIITKTIDEFHGIRVEDPYGEIQELEAMYGFEDPPHLSPKIESRMSFFGRRYDILFTLPEGGRKLYVDAKFSEDLSKPHESDYKFRSSLFENPDHQFTFVSQHIIDPMIHGGSFQVMITQPFKSTVINRGNLEPVPGGKLEMRTMLNTKILYWREIPIFTTF